jgi:SAM-dependent methyltransferase
MKYCVKGVDIHSDRAALPSNRKSKRFLAFLSRLGRHESCLDYGCGKLRHLEEMLSIFAFLTVVDSTAQLMKSQRIHGTETTIENFCARFEGRVRAFRLESTSQIKRRHDWAFLNNVLSAIPFRRERIRALQNVRLLLRRRGKLLLVSQYENSKFKQFEKGVPHLDGHVYRSRRGHHFFGRISARTLIGYLRETGFEKIEIRSVKGYFFVTAQNRFEKGVRLRDAQLQYTRRQTTWGSPDLTDSGRGIKTHRSPHEDADHKAQPWAGEVQ